MYATIDDYFITITEGLQIDFSTESFSSVNKFSKRPSGIVIQDSYNNPFFPIRPLPRIDTSKLEILELTKRYQELYGLNKTMFLPWHFCVEMVKDDYVVFNTRPLDIMFPKSTQDIISNLDNNILLDNSVSNFIKKQPFDLKDAIHICIIGDTDSDVYTKSIYDKIGGFCVTPMIRTFKMSSLSNSVNFLNIGKRFNKTNIEKFSII